MMVIPVRIRVVCAPKKQPFSKSNNPRLFYFYWKLFALIALYATDAFTTLTISTHDEAKHHN